MAIKYTSTKGLGKGISKISTPKAPLKRGARQTVTAGRTIKKEITYTGPQATCNDVASFIANCAQVQNALLSRFDSTSWAAIIVDHENRIIALENAGFITCTTLVDCPVIQQIQSDLLSKIECSDLLAGECRENIEDIVGAMIGYQVGISVVYNDTTGKIDFVVQPGCNDFCNYVMACDGIQDIIARLNDLEAQTVDSILSCTDVQNCMAPAVTNLQSQIDSILTNFCGTVMSCPGIIDLRNDVDTLIAQIAVLTGTTDAVLTCTDVQNCMAPTILGIQNQITQINDNLNNLQIEHDADTLNLQNQISQLQDDLLDHIMNDQIQTCADVMACPGIAQLVNDVSNLITDFCTEVATCINTNLDTQSALNNRFITSSVTQEQVQDWAAELFTNGVHTNISFFYNDASNRIDATVLIPPFDCDDVANCISTHPVTIEAVQDLVGDMFNHLNHTNVTVNYNDTTGQVEITAGNQIFGRKEQFNGNGVNVNYPLISVPLSDTFIARTDSGTFLEEGEDFNIVGQTMVFVIAPGAGEIIRVQYLYTI